MSESKNGKLNNKPTINIARVSTAVFIVAAVLGAIYFGVYGISLLFLLIVILGGFELGNIIEGMEARLAKYLHIIVAACPILLFRIGKGGDSVYFPLLVASILVMTFLIINLWRKGLPYNKLRYLFTFFYWGLPFGLGAHYLYHSSKDGPLLFLGIIFLLWISDTMAYFTGKAFGKNKLFPSVSPGKTIEGSLGAGFFSVITGALFAYFTDQSMQLWIMVGLLVWIIGTLGDLVESKLKRVQSVKDSGGILPGHGGFLDRFDSLVMVIPYLLLLDYLF